MQPQDLVRMANQIAANLRADGEAEAVAAIAAHLRQFWEPRMVADLRAAVAARRADGLSPQVVQALQRL